MATDRVNQRGCREQKRLNWFRHAKNCGSQQQAIAVLLSHDATARAKITKKMDRGDEGGFHGRPGWRKCLSISVRAPLTALSSSKWIFESLRRRRSPSAVSRIRIRRPSSGSVTWDAANLDKYLTNPRAMVPDTSMVHAGLKDDAERADLVAYLETLH